MLTTWHLKLVIVLLWAVWSTIVFLTNLTDGLRELGLLADTFPFASGNFAAIAQVTAVYQTPAAISALLFGAVLAWEGLNAGLFWWVVQRSRSLRDGHHREVNTAFILATGLWAAFMVMDEIFLAYRVAAFEQTHRSVFIAVLVSFLVIRLLPNELAPGA